MTTTGTVRVTINGQVFETAAGKMVLPVALENGIPIPHYCYHPALSIAGNCRMCLVEIEGVPKLQTSCSTEVKDGMVIRTDTERVRTAVRHVLEFLLINHPVDCPVCDQAGECGLQEYYMAVGRYDCRFAENKVTKTKKATPIGKWVMLDQERCILCSRCVRFSREITRTGEMAIFNRGDHAEIDVFPGKTVENRYSANIIDICPVGALTCRDFRFKCRVWYLNRSPSICPGCARGCAIEIHSNPERPHHGNGRRIMRLKPRPNSAVNQFWICDEGRYGYHFIDENRLRHCTIAVDSGRRQLYQREALDRVVELLVSHVPSRTLYLLSPDSSNESLFAAKMLFLDHMGITCLAPDTGIHTGDADDFLIHEDKHPNTRGLKEIFGLNDAAFFPIERLPDIVREKGITLVIINNLDMPKVVLDSLKTDSTVMIYFGVNENRTAHSVHLNIALAAYAEQDGTFTNCQGRLQRFTAAVPLLGEAEPEWAVIEKIAKGLGRELYLGSTAGIFHRLANQVLFFKGIEYQAIGPQGVLIKHD